MQMNREKRWIMEWQRDLVVNSQKNTISRMKSNLKMIQYNLNNVKSLEDLYAIQEQIHFVECSLMQYLGARGLADMYFEDEEDK